MSSRGRPVATSHAEIEQVAFRLFAERGFEAVTMADIAAAVGVGRRTLFRYFESKNDIPWGQFDHSLDGFRELLAAMPDDLPLHEAVHLAVRRFNELPRRRRSPATATGCDSSWRHRRSRPTRCCGTPPGGPRSPSTSPPRLGARPDDLLPAHRRQRRAGARPLGVREVAGRPRRRPRRPARPDDDRAARLPGLTVAVADRAALVARQRCADLGCLHAVTQFTSRRTSCAYATPHHSPPHSPWA